MSIELFIAIALILLVSSVLQSAIGFGYGLLAVPLGVRTSALLGTALSGTAR
jgi:hypothetical protein